MTRLNGNTALLGAILMIVAGVAFAAVNLAVQWATMRLGATPAAVVFWQYAVALILVLPLIDTRAALRDGAWGWQMARVALAAVGVQFWVYGLAYVPIWQAISLILLSPVFVTLGAAVILGERVTPARWGAVTLGLLGGVVVLAPWSDGFGTATLYPLAAAAFWAASSVLTKRLALREDAGSLTFWLLALLVPVNFALAVPTGFGVSGDALMIVALAGVFTAIAQYALASAYRRADAAYLQPFDHLKLPLNVLFGFLAFGFAPEGWIWAGVAMILCASIWVLWDEA